jgi:threonine/homoserine/homoserine lactone efflux protein
VAVVFSLSPGPDTVLVVNRALGHGCRTALVTALGSASGLLVWGIASAVGIAAVFRASATAFTAMRLAGAAYLVVLGLQAIHRARQQAAESAQAPVPGLTERRQPPRRRFRQGLLTNLLNPKAGAFFVAVLPQFIGVDQSVLATTLFFATLDAGIAMIAPSLYTMLALGAGALLRRPAARRAVDRVSGAILIVLGIRLAASFHRIPWRRWTAEGMRTMLVRCTSCHLV